MSDDADFDELNTRLHAELQVAPIREVLGVVAPSGAAGCRAGGTDLWSLLFGFEAWRFLGEELRTGKLRISKDVTDEELAKYRRQIKAYDVVRIRARVGESAFGGHQAILVEFLGADASDHELKQFSEKLQEPETFEDAVFGTCTLNRDVDWFTANVVWDGQEIILNLDNSEEDVEEAVNVAHTLWQDQGGWSRRIRAFAVQELLPMKNEGWLDDGEDELTPDEFLARMTLESLHVHADGSFDFWHDDGDLFWGHAIEISGNLEDGPTRADIPG